jgi:plastocyanin
LGFSSASSSQEVTVTGKLELFREGSASLQDSSSGVVWLTRVGETGEQPAASSSLKLQLVQKNKSFNPHLVVVQVGSSVAFPNKDPFFHNVFSLIEGKRFDWGLYEAGTSRTVVFDREGISYIFCNIHPEMSSVVVALKTPYYGISDARGSVTIPDVRLDVTNCMSGTNAPFGFARLAGPHHPGIRHSSLFLSIARGRAAKRSGAA